MSETPRDQKRRENADRAERLTGVHPISGDGWEKVCVLLMDKLESLRKEDSPRPFTVYPSRDQHVEVPRD